MLRNRVNPSLARLFLCLCTLIPVAIGVYGIYFLYPLNINVNLAEAYQTIESYRYGGFIWDAARWLVAVILVSFFQIRRLSFPQRSFRDAPYSYWRVARSGLFCVGAAGFGAFFSWSGTTSVVRDYVDLERLSYIHGWWVFPFVAVGFFALIAAWLMVIVDGRARQRHSSPEMMD